MIEPTTTDLDDIKAAVTDDKLVERALLDAIEAFAQFAVRDRPPDESIRLLANWKRTFEKFGRHK